MKNILTSLFMLLFLCISVLAQENKTVEKNTPLSLSVNADLVSRYIWRGQQLGGFAIQPLTEISYKGLAFGTFGSYAFDSKTPTQEADLYISYTFKDMVTLSINDYFFPVDFSKNNYNEYRADSTSHVIEPTLTIDGTEKGFPLALLLGVNTYGADSRNIKNEMNYSTYAELSFNSTLKDTNISLFVGGSLKTPGDNLPSFYGNTKPGIVNFGISLSKEIKVSNTFSVPISTSIISNPDAGNFYVVFSASFGN